MNLNENNTIKETNLINKAGNKKPYHHQNTTPYKNYQHHNHHNTPKDKFRPLGFSSPYHGNHEVNSGFSQYNNQIRNFKDSNRKNYGKNNRYNQNNNRNTKNSSGEENISQYFHPSMLEDPWKKLEEQHRKVQSKSPASSGGDSSPSSVT